MGGPVPPLTGRLRLRAERALGVAAASRPLHAAAWDARAGACRSRALRLRGPALRDEFSLRPLLLFCAAGEFVSGGPSSWRPWLWLADSWLLSAWRPRARACSGASCLAVLPIGDSRGGRDALKERGRAHARAGTFLSHCFFGKGDSWSGRDASVGAWPRARARAGATWSHCFFGVGVSRGGRDALRERGSRGRRPRACHCHFVPDVPRGRRPPGSVAG